MTTPPLGRFTNPVYHFLAYSEAITPDSTHLVRLREFKNAVRAHAHRHGSALLKNDLDTLQCVLHLHGLELCRLGEVVYLRGIRFVNQ